jgi:hypothetical protein
VLGVSTVVLSLLWVGVGIGVCIGGRCKSCLRTFNDKSGTDFEYTP